MMEMLKEAKAAGEEPEEFLQNRIATEDKAAVEAQDLIQVQIMPHNTIAGYGRWPDVPWMPRHMAGELAPLGKVKIIEQDSDIVAEDDGAAISEHEDELMDARMTSDRKVADKVKTARRTNVGSRGRKQVEEGATGEVEATPGEVGSRRQRRG